MDTEKKPKRPRIGATPIGGSPIEQSHYEKVNFGGDTPHPATDNGREGYQPRPYQPHPYQGGYQQRPRMNTYGQGASYNKPQGDGEDAINGESNDVQQPYSNYRPHNDRSGGYQPRQQGYQPRQQGGYQPRQQGYQQRQPGGYQQGGYQQRQQGGYQQGGYQRQQGGYQPRQQSGYQQRQPGGYQQRQPGGYNRQPNQRNTFRQQAQRFTPRPKQIEYTVDIPDPDSEMRLNKFMSNAGICSRREADEKIQAGAVTVNGKVVTELGTKIKPADVVEYDGKVVVPERKCYVLLNKPKNCVTTSDDPGGRTTVLDIVKNACRERIYPVGRLDRNTTGVLLLTNDGDLASKLTHPKFVKKKIYHVWTDKAIAEEDMQRIADGIELDDGEIHADEISYVSDTDRKQAGIEIHSGRNRIVRRIFEALGYRVVKLDRVYFAGLTKKNLPRGKWRYLTQEEVNYLRQGSFE
ncbi:ribosomal large subunit pseudouridine synthase B [Prevotella sp. CAG:485]|nr:ribosomal large subunit pseudouridine synthase B [Prevotella sp. CAG:485]